MAVGRPVQTPTKSNAEEHNTEEEPPQTPQNTNSLPKLTAASDEKIAEHLIATRMEECDDEIMEETEEGEEKPELATEETKATENVPAEPEEQMEEEEAPAEPEKEVHILIHTYDNIFL